MNKPDEAKPGTDLTEVETEYRHFIGQFQSLIMATVNEDGTPLASYTPFAIDDEKQFYIYISTLSGHTANIERTGQLSIMLIEDEETTEQIFARKRLTFQCQATLLERDSPAWQTACDIYQDRFGQFFEMIKTFSDFRMFKLSPFAGSFVLGFGQAYQISGEKLDILTHRQRT